jgi:UDP-N-acetylglucosamine 2-epimerase
VVFPVHPRTRKRMAELGLGVPHSEFRNARFLDPVGYLDMVRLEQGARMILTDSGGVQKEAYWLGVPCVTLRDETEWVETVEAGWNTLAGADPERILVAVRTFAPPAARPALYGDGQAASHVVRILSSVGAASGPVSEPSPHA